MTSLYHWVHAPDGTKYHNVGILEDGTLRNPNGYPEDLVRQAVLDADERRRQRRSASAQKATVTRKNRHERKVYQAAKRIMGGHKLGPLHRCVICSKILSDQESVDRGIGSDCWQGVLGIITARKAQA